MLYTSKIFFLLLIITRSAFSMECTTAPIGSGQARTYANYIDSRLAHELDQKLIALSDEHNPARLLNNLAQYYQKKRSEIRLRDYISHFKVNVIKIARYTNLVRKINREIFGSILIAGIQNNSLEQAEQDLLEMDADGLAKEVIEREWALESTQCDLEEQLSKIKSIDTSMQDAINRIPLVEKQDEAFVRVTEKIKAQQIFLERAVYSIKHRQKIYKINRDTINFILQKANKGTLQKTLGELSPVSSLQNINGLFKASNPSRNSILHALCDNQAIPLNEFRVVVEFFTKHGQNINEVNANGESILDYAQNKPLGSEYVRIIQESGGLPLKNLKPSLKKPEAKASTQAKKILRISDDNSGKKERVEQRALTQSMGLL